MTTYVTPRVSAQAARFGIDVSTVVGTGAGGRISVADVLAAAVARGAAPQPGRTVPTPTARAPRVRVPDRSSVRVRSSMFDQMIKVQIDDYALNPVLDDLRQARPDALAARAAVSPTPTLFPTGDLPVFLSSGEDPSCLTSVPWNARRALATLPAADFASAFEELATDQIADALAAANLRYDGAENNVYERRFMDWMTTPVDRLRAIHQAAAAEPSLDQIRRSPTYMNWPTIDQTVPR